MNTARRVVAGLCVVALVVLSGCGRTKEDMISKARDIKSRTELERVLGRPDDVQKLGPLETWTYKASNGRVVFMIVGDTVTLQAAGSDDKERR